MKRSRLLALFMAICITLCMTALTTACGSKDKAADTKETAAADGETEELQGDEEETAEESEFPKTMYVTADDGLRLRKGPDKKKDSLLLLSYGQEIQVEKIENGWANTTVEGKTGWCSADYLTENKSDIKVVDKSTGAEIDPDKLVKPADDSESGYHGYVDSPEGLNMRYGPGSEYHVIDVIPDKTELTELGWTEGWVYIMWKGKYGWISAQYFRMER